MNATNLPLVGISSCLVGNKVRYDGKHKFNDDVEQWIRPYATLLPFCPESVAGMGIPRPPINLIQTTNGIQAVGRDNPEKNFTERLTNMADVFANSHPQLRGFICQSRSPSCGFHTTPILNPSQNETLIKDGNGLFINRLIERFPNLVIINENELTKESAKTFLSQLTSN